MLLIMLMMSSATQVFSQMNFTGHTLYVLTPTDEKQLVFVENLKKMNEVDMWNDPIKLNQHINVHVPPNLTSKLEKEWREEGIDFSVVTGNLQQWIDDEKEDNEQDMSLRDPDNIPLDQYHNFDTINYYMDMVSEKYSPIATVEIIGTTYEGNPIKGLKIGRKGFRKPAVWIDAGIHAREWVGPATAIYIIEQLLKGYDTDADIKDLVDTFDWHIFPVINVDGYKYTFTHNRLWRKNRNVLYSKSRMSFCKGVDPNRNFDSEFAGVGTNGDKCSITYRGPSAFSEAESRAIRDGILSLGDTLKAYFSLHAYSQLWMTPYGKSLENPPDYEDHMKALKAASDAMLKIHRTKYRYGTVASTIYPAASSSVDWAYDKAHVKYSFGIELRDTGKHGFFLGNHLIIPTAEENFAGIKAVANLIKKELI